MDGILLFDKPLLWTSHDAVDYVRARTGQRAVGHAGTLDPMATGLLILLLGKATKLSAKFSQLDKDYRGLMMLGVTTDTQDLDGRILSEREASTITQSALEEVFSRLRGKISQTPPAFSALKQKGRKLYEMARKGIAVTADSREVTVAAFEILRFTPPEVAFFVSCSKGTYVRSLCHEAGDRLGCGAVLSALVRTRIGSFHLKEAIQKEQIDNAGIAAIRKCLHDYL